MILSPRSVNWFIRGVFRLVCRVHIEGLERLPRQGPLILVGNHVTFLEVPVAMAFANNSNITALAKKKSWENPLFRFLFDLWDIIPIDLNGLDREAFQRAGEALREGKILTVFPEGTRSRGQMLQGRPGITALAQRSGAAIIPIGFYGYENFWDNLKHLRRTDFHMVVGQPFRLNLNGAALSRDVRQAATDEIMYKIAELVPERYRGYYAYSGSVNYRFTTPV